MTTTTQASTYTADDVAAAKRLAGRDWTELTRDERLIVIQLQRVHGLLGKSEDGHVGPFQERGHEAV